jgi:hypothetical protein
VAIESPFRSQFAEDAHLNHSAAARLLDWIRQKVATRRSIFGESVVEANDFTGIIELHEKISQNKSDRKGCQNQQKEVRCQKEKEVVHPVRKGFSGGGGCGSRRDWLVAGPD